MVFLFAVECTYLSKRITMATKERGRKMKIIDVLNSGKVSVSCELFPPKAGGNFEPVVQAADAIAALRPDFMSVNLWRRRRYIPKYCSHRISYPK